MTFIMEKDESTAARRRIPFRLFDSNGTSPDTGATDDAMVLAINSAQTFSADSTCRALESAQGMYWLELTQSECSVLGLHALYHTVGAFPQHVANFVIVNSNPYSTESHGAYLQPTTAGRTLDVTATGAAGIDWANVEGQATAVDLSATDIQLVDTATAVTNNVSADVVQISGDGGAADNLEAAFDGTGYTSAMTITKVSSVTLDPVAHTGATVPTVTDVTNQVTADATAISGDATAANNLEAAFDGTGYASTLTVIGVTSGVTIIPAAYSGVTVGVDDIAAATYSGVTVEATNAALGTGVIDTAQFAASGIDAAALATDAINEIADGVLDRNMATGTDSGSSAVRTPRDALRALRNRVVLSDNTMSVYEEDDTTVKWTASVTTTGDSVFPTALDPNA